MVHRRSRCCRNQITPRGSGMLTVMSAGELSKAGRVPDNVNLYLYVYIIERRHELGRYLGRCM